MTEKKNQSNDKKEPIKAIPFTTKVQSKKSKKKSSTSKFGSESSDEEVLLNLPAGMKYKMPDKKQRVIVGSIVIGLNVLLVISVLLYFYSPTFQDFIYNVGRN